MSKIADCGCKSGTGGCGCGGSQTAKPYRETQVRDPRLKECPPSSDSRLRQSAPSSDPRIVLPSGVPPKDERIVEPSALQSLLKQMGVNGLKGPDLERIEQSAHEASRKALLARARPTHVTSPLFPRENCNWEITGWTMPLMDSRPCLDCHTPAIGYVVNTTSTCTLRLPDGRVRIYFQSPQLIKTETYTTVGTCINYQNGTSFPFPICDACGNSKFSTSSVLSEVETWWHADDNSTNADENTASYYFNRNYIAYLDSPNQGHNFPVYTPRMIPSGESGCGDQNGYVDYADVGNGRRAGWNSTSIRCFNRNLVYRDVSVIAIPSPDPNDVNPYYYIMLAVECDGRANNGVESDTCSICTTESSCSGGPPTTNLVVFISNTPDFQASDRVGPFSVMLTGRQVGVPQIFTNHEQDFVFISSGGFGLRVALMTRFQDAVVSAIIDNDGTKLIEAFWNLGSVEVFSRTECPPNTHYFNNAPTDAQYVFYRGRLHLFYKNSLFNDTDCRDNPDEGSNRISHAVAQVSLDRVLLYYYIFIREYFTNTDQDLPLTVPLFGRTYNLNGNTIYDQLLWFYQLKCEAVDVYTTYDATYQDTTAKSTCTDPDVFISGEHIYIRAHAVIFGSDGIPYQGLLTSKADISEIDVDCSDICQIRYNSLPDFGICKTTLC